MTRMMTVPDAVKGDAAVAMRGPLWYQLATVAGETGRVRDLVESAVREVYGRLFVSGEPTVDARDRARLRVLCAGDVTLSQIALKIGRPVDWVRRTAREMGLETARQRQIRESRERKSA